LGFLSNFAFKFILDHLPLCCSWLIFNFLLLQLVPFGSSVSIDFYLSVMMDLSWPHFTKNIRFCSWPHFNTDTIMFRASFQYGHAYAYGLISIRTRSCLRPHFDTDTITFRASFRYRHAHAYGLISIRTRSRLRPHFDTDTLTLRASFRYEHDHV